MLCRWRWSAPRSKVRDLPLFIYGISWVLGIQLLPNQSVLRQNQGEIGMDQNVVHSFNVTGVACMNSTVTVSPRRIVPSYHLRPQQGLIHLKTNRVHHQDHHTTWHFHKVNGQTNRVTTNQLGHRCHRSSLSSLCVKMSEYVRRVSS